MACVPSHAGERLSARVPSLVRFGGKDPYLLSHLASLVTVPTSSLVFTTFKANNITYAWSKNIWKSGHALFSSLLELSGGSFHCCEFVSVETEHL